MPPKLLTIAIPTFTRAGKLDRQLAWIDRHVGGFERSVRVMVSDNASTDATPIVCARWRDVFAARGIEFVVSRNDSNVGPLRNIGKCIEASTTRFTWVIGDDDEIAGPTLAFVVHTLRDDPELAALLLNFQGVGKTVYDRCFRFPADQRGAGRDLMSACLAQSYIGLAFMSAQVYRTEFAQAALRAWPDGHRNYDYQIFLTAFAALHGRGLVTRDTHVKYVTGENVYETNKRVSLALYADSLEVFYQLCRIGYPARLCVSLAWRHLWALKKRFIRRACQNNPLLTLATIGRATSYLFAITVSHLRELAGV
jgi:abequosyltransferase